MTCLKFRVIVVCLAAVLALGITLPLMAIQPPPIVLVMPADGAEVSGNSVTFSWNPSTWADTITNRWYTLQISSQSDFSTIVNTYSGIKATSKTVNNIPQDGSLYYWRVRVSMIMTIGGSPSTKQSDWSAPRMFLAKLAPPPPPASLISPAQGAQVTTIPIAFNWSPSSGAVKYHFQISTQDNFVSTFYNMEDINNTIVSVTPFPQNGSTYYWRVKAIDALGQGDWSQVRSFVSAPPPQPPPPASYAEPANGATVSGSAVALIWNASAGATRYHLQVAKLPVFPKVNLHYSNDNIAATQFAVPGMPNDGTKFYWRVRAFKEEGGWSAWNNVVFKTRHFFSGQSQTPPQGPLLVAPNHGADISENSITFNWKAAGGAAKYQLQIGTTNSFSAVFFNNVNISGTSFTVPNFPDQTVRYYWRVRACSAAGIWGNWSETRMFNTN
ncbi:MAG TPA: fibronectin type III domain-containing protein [Candidatus Aminicenantes bacterium]|nr:fibronectin type III domain-containing protein [Candidatus Aminicenantes bacterium]